MQKELLWYNIPLEIDPKYHQALLSTWKPIVEMRESQLSPQPPH